MTEDTPPGEPIERDRKPSAAGADEQTRDDMTAELAEDLAHQEGTAEAAGEARSAAPGGSSSARRARRNVVGPFSLRQVTIAIGLVMASAIVFTLATVPITQLVPNLPVPDPSAFLIGSPIPGLTVGDLAPELTVDGAAGPVQLTDLQGRPIRLVDLRGKAVWINYWASWCPPCQFETPTIRAIDERYRDRGLVVVGIQVQQTVQAGLNYAERYDLEYRIGADVTGEFFHLYRVFALPTQFFINPDGRIIAIVNGPMSDADASAIIESILPSGSSPAPSPNPT
jgi:peroxiredoxin